MDKLFCSTLLLFSADGYVEEKQQSTKREVHAVDYCQALKSLNESVLDWIKQHVERNPYIILLPVFKDYEKHLEDIEHKYPGSDYKSDADVKNKNEKLFHVSSVSSADQPNMNASHSCPGPPTFGTSATGHIATGTYFGDPHFNDDEVESDEVESNSKKSEGIPNSTGFSFGLNTSQQFSFSSSAAGEKRPFSSSTAMQMQKPAADERQKETEQGVNCLIFLFACHCLLACKVVCYQK